MFFSIIFKQYTYPRESHCISNLFAGLLVSGQQEALQHALHAMHSGQQRQMGIEERFANCKKVLRLHLQVQIATLNNIKFEQNEEEVSIIVKVTY